MDEPAYIDGRRYTQHVGILKQLTRAGISDQAIALLLRLVEATESEDRCGEVGVVPSHYEQLAIVYRKQGDRDDKWKNLSRFE